MVQKRLRIVGTILLTISLIEISLEIYGIPLFLTTVGGAVCVLLYAYRHRDE